MPPHEADIRNNLRKAVVGIGGYAMTQHGSAYSGRGRSDLTFIVAGIPFVVEVKTPTGGPTRIQLEHLRRVRAAGGCAFIGRDVPLAMQAIRLRMKGVTPYMEENFEIDPEMLRELEEKFGPSTVPTATESEAVEAPALEALTLLELPLVQPESTPASADYVPAATASGIMVKRADDYPHPTPPWASQEDLASLTQSMAILIEINQRILGALEYVFRVPVKDNILPFPVGAAPAEEDKQAPAAPTPTQRRGRGRPPKDE